MHSYDNIYDNSKTAKSYEIIQLSINTNFICFYISIKNLAMLSAGASCLALSFGCMFGSKFVISPTWNLKFRQLL